MEFIIIFGPFSPFHRVDNPGTSKKPFPRFLGHRQVSNSAKGMSHTEELPKKAPEVRSGRNQPGRMHTKEPTTWILVAVYAMPCHAMQATSKTRCAVPGRLEWAVGCGLWAVQVACGFQPSQSCPRPFGWVHCIQCQLHGTHYGVSWSRLSMIVDSSFTDHLLSLVFRPSAVGMAPTVASGLPEDVGRGLV